MEAYQDGQTLHTPAGAELTVERKLAEGAFAYSYAVLDHTGQRFLLKAYTDPVPDRRYCPWFTKYQALQDDIRKRLQPISGQALQTVQSFVQNGTYHQVIEWADGKSLGTLYAERLQKSGTFADRLLVARVVLFALSRIHEVRIVHCDQKLDNIYLQEDPGLALRYRVKIADFDMSLLDDHPSPKPEGGALAGTDGYRSPEHLRGQKPVLASDVFTVGGVILFELFAGMHPYDKVVAPAEDFATANRLILKAVERGETPSLDRLAPARAKEIPEGIKQTIEKCFASSPKDRPSAKEVHQALLGGSLPKRLVLRGGPTRLAWRIREPAAISRTMCTQMFAADTGTVSKTQAYVEPSADKTTWYLRPVAGTTNATMIGGKAVSGQIELQAGMRIQIGNAGTGKVGFELEVEFETV